MRELFRVIIYICVNFFTMTMDLAKIDTILFDLGGVVLNIAPHYTIDAFARLGLTDLHDQISHGHHNGLFKAFEQGNLSEDEFIAAIKEEIPNATEVEIRDAWSAMLLDIPLQRVRIIEDLKQKYKVYLLSNTNSLHRNCFDRAAEGYSSLADFFHQVYYSYELKVSKPDALAFQKVIELSGLNPATTLFLDDSLQNIETARQLGFQAVHITADYGLEQVFGEK